MLKETETLACRCRNVHCKSWLAAPVPNLRDAFCCAACEAGFYRVRCRVCEKDLGAARRNSRRELCGRRQCRNRFRSFRHQFFSVWYPSAARASKPDKSSTKSTVKTTIRSDRAWFKVAGPDAHPINYRIPLNRKTAADNTRTHKAYWQQAAKHGVALIQYGDPPINILGGYKFPGAKTVSRGPTAQLPAPAIKARAAELIAQIPADLSIPSFLRRRAG